MYLKSIEEDVCDASGSTQTRRKDNISEEGVAFSKFECMELDPEGEVHESGVTRCQSNSKKKDFSTFLPFGAELESLTILKPRFSFHLMGAQSQPGRSSEAPLR
ncbi:unnamed protein product [Caenorhabditis brenneri]